MYILNSKHSDLSFLMWNKTFFLWETDPKEHCKLYLHDWTSFSHDFWRGANVYATFRKTVLPSEYMDRLPDTTQEEHGLANYVINIF